MDNQNQNADVATVAKPLSPNEVRALAKVSRSQLRYWEATELVLPAFERHWSRQYRRYPPAPVDKILRIRRALDRGFRLDAIREFLTRQEPTNSKPQNQEGDGASSACAFRENPTG